MLKHIIGFISQLKTPERRLNVIMPLAATVVLFCLLIKRNGGNEIYLKERINIAEHDRDSIRKMLQLQVDDCNLQKLDELKKHNKDLENVVKDLDSVKMSLKK